MLIIAQLNNLLAPKKGGGAGYRHLLVCARCFTYLEPSEDCPRCAHQALLRDDDLVLALIGV